MHNKMPITKQPLFTIGQVVRHRFFPFRGVIFDVDAEFANSEEWWESIPAEIRPEKDQPYYHLFAENDDTSYEAYVSQQNLKVPKAAGSMWFTNILLTTLQKRFRSEMWQV